MGYVVVPSKDNESGNKRANNAISYKPRLTRMVREGHSVMDQVEDHDVMISYPYDSMESCF